MKEGPKILRVLNFKVKDCQVFVRNFNWVPKDSMMLKAKRKKSNQFEFLPVDLNPNISNHEITGLKNISLSLNECPGYAFQKKSDYIPVINCIAPNPMYNFEEEINETELVQKLYKFGYINTKLILDLVEFCTNSYYHSPAETQIQTVKVQRASQNTHEMVFSVDSYLQDYFGKFKKTASVMKDFAQNVKEDGVVLDDLKKMNHEIFGLLELFNAKQLESFIHDLIFKGEGKSKTRQRVALWSLMCRIEDGEQIPMAQETKSDYISIICENQEVEKYELKKVSFF